MRIRPLSWIFLLLFAGLSLSSCSEELNFDQADQLQVTPTVASSLALCGDP